MARLPSEQYLIQQINGRVILFEDGSEIEIINYDVMDNEATAKAQGAIFQSDLSEEDKSFAHFWSGYFYGATHSE